MISYISFAIHWIERGVMVLLKSYQYCLVVWKIFYFPIYWEESSQLIFIFFQRVETTNQNSQCHKPSQKSPFVRVAKTILQEWSVYAIGFPTFQWIGRGKSAGNHGFSLFPMEGFQKWRFPKMWGTLGHHPFHSISFHSISIHFIPF